MKVYTETETIETIRRELSSEDIERLVLVGLGIKKIEGQVINFDFDISCGFLRGAVISTRTNTKK